MKAQNMMRSMIVAVILSAFAATGLFAQGGNGKGKRAGERGQKIEQALAKLDLTDQQKAEIERLREAFKAKNEGAINEMKTLRETMKAQRQNGDADGAKATKEQIKVKREALKKSGEELRQQIMAVLTDAQKAQLNEMKEKGKGKGKKGKKNKS